MKGNLLLHEQRNHAKMTNSVMLKNDIKGMQTYMNGRNKTIRQGQSMRFSHFPTASNVRKTNYSPPKRTNNFTHLPSL